MAGFKWSLDWDTNPIKKGGQIASDAIDDAADVFEDFAKSADKSTETAGDALKESVNKGTDSAKTDLKSLETAIRDAADSGKKDFKKTGDSIGDDVQHGTDKGSEAVGEFKNEARANFAEVASSFSGDMASAADGVQGTLGGLAGSIPGPVGLIAGVLAGIGGGMLSNMVTSTEDTKEIVSTMYDDLLASADGYYSEDYKKSVYWDILKGESKVLKKKDLEEIADWAMTTNENVALAYAGDAVAMGLVTEGLTAKRKLFEDQLNDETTTNDSAAQKAIDWIDGYLGKGTERLTQLQQTSDAVSRGKTTYDEYGAGGYAALDAIKRGYDNVHGAVTAIPDIKTVTVNVDLTEAKKTLSAWVPSVLINPQLRPGYYQS